MLAVKCLFLDAEALPLTRPCSNRALTMEERTRSHCRSSSKESRMYRFEEYKQGGRYTVVQESTVSSTGNEANDPKLQQYESSLHKFKGTVMCIIRKVLSYYPFMFISVTIRL